MKAESLKVGIDDQHCQHNSPDRRVSAVIQEGDKGSVSRTVTPLSSSCLGMRLGKTRTKQMTADESQTLDAFLAEIDKIRLHRSNGLGAALKKPLLLLLLLSKFERGELSENRVLFSDVEAPLGKLILRFGGRPGRHGSKPEQPFDHLQSSRFWNLVIPGVVRDNFARTLSCNQLRAPGCFAWLDEEVYQLLLRRPEARTHVEEHVLNRWWPETVHPEIRLALGLQGSDTDSVQAPRNPEFARQVLENYRFRCAVCGFDALLNELPFGLDAAHIRWHSQQGPDTLDNGLALCKLHHWALDRGVITVRDRELTVQVSPHFIARDCAAVQGLEKLEGCQLASPRGLGPRDDHLIWHRRNVFIE